MRWFGRTKQPGRTLKRKDELRSLPPVQAALMHIEEGGFCEAVIRMLILLADSGAMFAATVWNAQPVS